MSLKRKLLFVIILPILGMLYFSSINIYQKYIASKEADIIYSITMLNTKISSYIHEMQKERGLSSGYLSSKGNEFFEELQKQRTITDKYYNEVNNHLNNINLKHFDKKFNEFKNEFPLQYNELQEHRIHITNFSISVNEAVSSFSMINALYLNFIYSTSENTKNTKISRMILAYSNFLLAKEKTGIQRAIMMDMLLDNKLHKKNKIQLNKLQILRQSNIAVFLKLIADESIISKYESIRNSKEILIIRKMEKDFLKKTVKSNINVEVLFSKLTKRINNQKIISDTISKKLLELSSKSKNLATKQMIIFIMLSIFILFVFIVIVIVIYKNINMSLKSIVDFISVITKDGVSEFKEIKQVSNDELGQISVTLNKMAYELKKQKEETEQFANAKSEFLANMSHEIRTPLNAVLGFIDLLKEENLGKKSIEYLDIIDKSSKSLLQIIEDILDFSKIESGKLEIDSIDFDTQSEFEIITHLFQAKCLQKKIYLSLTIDKNLPKYINSDPLRIKQIITNLLSNAVKFTKSGKSIVVSISYISDFLVVSVKDEGIGIDIDKQKHIFESFGQADSSTTRMYGGTGLGLSISSELVSLLGGTLKVKSEIGKGSEFYFKIPVKVGKSTELNKNNLVSSDFSNFVLLLVEDNKANQIFMKVILNKMKIKFDIANDGQEAIEKFKSNKYDTVLMDENMPNMNGIEATKHILDYEKNNNLLHTPIIALTANALKGDRERFIEVGMDEYLTKPINQNKLIEVFNTFLIKNKTGES